MAAWTGLVLAPGGPGSDALRSRLPTCLHPLAGRPLAWHAARAVAVLAPGRLTVVGGPELGPELFSDLPGTVRVLDVAEGIAAALRGGEGRLLAVDALAPTVERGLPALLDRTGDALLEGSDGAVLAAWLGPEGAALLASVGGELGALAGALPRAERVRDEAVFGVRSRACLARASVEIRDRVVRRLMDEGVTFLLPDSVLVDVGVTIGRDTVVYPGAVIEGDTTIGAESVIGPCCRIVAARIGSGVELKGYNYVSHTAIRNRAILEAYVRRGYDE